MGDEVIVSRKPTGTLVLGDLKPGKRLYLLGTGTGLAPFMSIIRDPDVYERFETIVVCHGVRHVNDLAYADYIQRELPQHEYLGEMVQKQLVYYPSVTPRTVPQPGPYHRCAGSTAHSAKTTGLPPLDPAEDRAMICGSPSMLEDTCALLDGRGFVISPRTRQPGDYVIERAFVEK